MGLNYASAFTAATSVTRSGATHGLGTNALRVQVYDSSTAGLLRRTYPGITVHGSTFDIGLSFPPPGIPGVLLVNAAAPSPVGALGNYGVAVTTSGSPPTATILGTAHNYGTANLLVDVYDSAGNLYPFAAVTINTSTFAVTVGGVQAQNLYVVLCAAADTGTPNITQTFTGLPNIGLLESLFPLGTRNKGVQLYDNATPANVFYAEVNVDPSTWNVVAVFAQNQSGRIVVNGSQQGVLKYSQLESLLRGAHRGLAVGVR